MVNAWLLLSGIGMMLAGILFPIYWWRTQKVPVKYFGYGAVLWIIAMTPKILLDLTISPALQTYALGYGIEAFVIITGIYIGLRTGLFESGFTYLAGLKTKLKNVTFKQAVAFGLGFGGFEAFITGALSFLNIYLFVVMPDLVNQLPETQKELIVQQLNQSTWIVIAPIMERVFVIFIHVFATLLVFYALKTARRRYLLYSIGYKSIVDGIIPFLQVYVGSQTLLGVYVMELPFVGLGCIALAGIWWTKKRWSDDDHAA